MNGPMRLTDKERILVLEARCADLQAELDAMRAWGQEKDVAELKDSQIDAMRPHLRRGDRQAGGRATAACLLMLLDQPGRFASKDRLFSLSQTISGNGASEDGSALSVRMFHLRAALTQLGFPGVIIFQHQAGWCITPNDAERIKTALLGAELLNREST